MADTPLEESNLAGIGSDADKAARKAAAELEVDWAGAGAKPGLQIWRVENTRNEDGSPNFGINPWPEDEFGEFYRGDSYIVLKTTEEEEGGELKWDVHFWIGSNSSQDEYTVAAYKTVELDDLLGGAPIQHREVEGHESKEFMSCFPNQSISYLDGGVASGFRHVQPDEYVPRLLRVQKKGREVRAFQVPLGSDSLNHGDTFILDAGTVVYTWFGDTCSPFEKAKAAEVAHNIVSSRHGKATLESDTEGNDSFWAVMGGEGEVKSESNYNNDDIPVQETKMWILSDEDSVVRTTEVPADKDNLKSDDVCIIDNGPAIIVWIGSGASRREAQEAMVHAQNHITAYAKPLHTNIVRILEGQEDKSEQFNEMFP